MLTLVKSIHIIIAFLITAAILLQQGTEVGMKASFSNRSSQTIFGSGRAMPFLFKLTALLAVVFFVTSLSLNYIGRHVSNVQRLSSQGVSQLDYQKYQAQSKLLKIQPIVVDSKSKSKLTKP